jgi:hypothetical protein
LAGIVSALRDLGLASGNPITIDVVPWKGVKLAIADHLTKPCSDGRASVAERVATAHGLPHDLVLIAVPRGKGKAIVRRLADGEVVAR